MLSVTVILWFYVENGSKFTRGKKQVRESIDTMITHSYSGTKLDDTEHRLEFHYNSDENLSIQNESNGLYWDEYNGGWK